MNKETKVVHYHHSTFDTYIGRPSIFGNPFKIGKDGNREEVIKKYRDWFYTQLENEWFKKKVLELKGKTLGCWCKPELCHGDIIADYLDNLYIEEREDGISVLIDIRRF